MMGQQQGIGAEVSVVLPVYNAKEHVGSSIRSILDQTFEAFELIIIDDGSSDGSEAVIRTFDDPRIRYFRQENKGLAHALNRGIAESRSALIARHDHDDIAHPERLAKQVAYMRDAPEIGLLGTWATRISSSGEKTGVLEHAVDHGSICFMALFDSPFVHPSVMFRKSVFDAAGPYDADPAIFEDLEMWQRMLRITHAANLPEHLVLYRDVPSGISNTTRTRNEQLMECRRRELLHHFPDLNGRELELLSRLGIGHPMISAKELLSIHGRLYAFIENSVKDGAVRRALRHDLQKKMMSYRIMPHDTTFHRALDKLRKFAVLSFSTPPHE